MSLQADIELNPKLLGERLPLFWVTHNVMVQSCLRTGQSVQGLQMPYRAASPLARKRRSPVHERHLVFLLHQEAHDHRGDDLGEPAPLPRSGKEPLPLRILLQYPPGIQLSEFLT